MLLLGCDDIDIIAITAVAGNTTVDNVRLFVKSLDEMNLQMQLIVNPYFHFIFILFARLGD